MAKILVGTDGSIGGEGALKWAVRRAERDGASLTIATVVDADAMRASGVTEEAALTAAHELLGELQKSIAEQHPQLKTKTIVARGEVVETLATAADNYDLVVVGSSRGASVADSFGGVLGLRVSSLTKSPTAVIPVDWKPEEEDAGKVIVVAVGPDSVSEGAVAFGVREADAAKQPLDLVSAWGLPALLSKPAKAMGGELVEVGNQFQARLDERVRLLKGAHPELEITGHAQEGPAPARVLVEYSEKASLLVLGTHGRSALGRFVFGSVTHGVLSHLRVPTVVVPQP